MSVATAGSPAFRRWFPVVSVAGNTLLVLWLWVGNPRLWQQYLENFALLGHIMLTAIGGAVFNLVLFLAVLLYLAITRRRDFGILLAWLVPAACFAGAVALVLSFGVYLGF